MALLISDLEVRLSGGTTNTAPLNSLGGIRSTDADGVVLSQAATDTTAVTGVTFTNAYSNAIGDGTISWNQDTKRLSWKPFSAVSAVGVDIATDTGSTPTPYVVGDSNGYVIVSVIYSSLPEEAGTHSDSDITISNRISNVFDAVTANQSTNGLIEYRCLYIHNAGGDTAYDVRIWMKQQPVGPDDIDLALNDDPAVPGDGQSTGVAIGPINGETDIDDDLSALVWSAPSTQASGLLLGNIAAGEGVAFWEKRIVPAGTTQQESNDTSKIGISALV